MRNLEEIGHISHSNAVAICMGDYHHLQGQGERERRDHRMPFSDIGGSDLVASCQEALRELVDVVFYSSHVREEEIRYHATIERI